MKTLILATNTADFFLSHRIHLGEMAKAKAFKVVVMAPPSPLEKEILAKGFKFYPLPMSRKGLNPLIEIKVVLAYANAFKELNPDVYHGFTIKPVIYGLLANYIRKVPKNVVTITGLGYVFLKTGFKGKLLRWITKLLYKVALKKAHKVTFQNYDDEKLFIESNLVAKEKSVIIPGTGVDTNEYSPKPAPEEPCTFVFPARFLSDKGIYELMHATQILHKREHHFVVRLCGKLDPGNPASLTQHELNDYMDQDEVKLVGFVKDMSQEFLTGRVAVLPSYREGISLSLIEACSSGLMIITSDAPGCRDVVTHGENGLLVPVGDAESLANAMEQAILDPKKRLWMGQASRAKALEYFEKSKVNGMNLALYH